MKETYNQIPLGVHNSQFMISSTTSCNMMLIRWSFLRQSQSWSNSFIKMITCLQHQRDQWKRRMFQRKRQVVSILGVEVNSHQESCSIRFPWGISQTITMKHWPNRTILILICQLFITFKRISTNVVPPKWKALKHQSKAPHLEGKSIKMMFTNQTHVMLLRMILR